MLTRSCFLPHFLQKDVLSRIWPEYWPWKFNTFRVGNHLFICFLFRMVGFLGLPDTIKGMKSLEHFDLSVNPLGRYIIYLLCCLVFIAMLKSWCWFKLLKYFDRSWLEPRITFDWIKVFALISKKQPLKSILPLKHYFLHVTNLTHCQLVFVEENFVVLWIEV